MYVYNATYEEKLSSTISLCILYSTALLCSGLVLFLTYYSKLYETKVNLLMANVALADFVFILFQFILQPPNIMSDDHWFIPHWCGYVTYSTGLIGDWFTPVVVMNRYISIFHSTIFKRVYTLKNIMLMNVGGWLATIAISSLFHFGGHTGFEWQYLNCGIVSEDSLLWEILFDVLVVGPTFVGNGITAFCNYRIFLKLREHSKNTNGMKTNVMAQNKQLLYATVLQTGFAVCLQSPYILGKLVPSVVEGNVLRQIFPLLYIFNCTINPVTTLYVLKPYRRAFTQLVRGVPKVAPHSSTQSSGAPKSSQNQPPQVRAEGTI